MHIGALILAGGSLRESPGVPKGLLSFGGKTLVRRALDACLESSSVEMVCVVAPENVLYTLPAETQKPLISILDSGDLVSNVIAGTEALGSDSDRWVLIVTGDLPFITRETIDTFIDECRRLEADGYYSILDKEQLERDYPGTKRTYGRVREGVFTGGNVFLIRSSLLLANKELMRRLYDARKSPVRLAGIVGIPLLIKYLLKSMTIADAERRVSRIVGAPVRAVRTTRSEIGIDVDKPEDIAYIEKLYARGGGVAQ
jgi:CTP:molybdopterin cytidylyltransferase MocA